MSFSMPDPPAPPPPPPSNVDAQRAVDERRAGERRRRTEFGRGSTILTSEEGVSGASAARRVLLGE